MRTHGKDWVEPSNSLESRLVEQRDAAWDRIELVTRQRDALAAALRDICYSHSSYGSHEMRQIALAALAALAALEPLVFRCAGPSCPGLSYKASDTPHPASCAKEVAKACAPGCSFEGIIHAFCNDDDLDEDLNRRRKS